MQTSKDELNSFIKNLPSPLNKEKFSLLKKGIWDNNKIDVFINKKKDFTFLFPQPEINYEKYVPRKKKIGLAACKEKIVIQENQRRYFKIHNHFSWLVKKIPGGDEELFNLFKKTNQNYIEDLEKSKNTDSVIMILRNRR